MTRRDRVIEYLTEEMDLHFMRGELEDAQDYLHVRAHFLTLSDEEYDHAYAEVTFVDG